MYVFVQRGGIFLNGAVISTPFLPFYIGWENRRREIFMDDFYLWDLDLGGRARVLTLPCDPPLPIRLLDMGLVAGTEILCLSKSAGEHLGAYGLRGTMLGIRWADASRIPVRVLGGDDFG